MQWLLALLALLSATPAVAQWTVTTHVGGKASFDPLAYPKLPLAFALDPGSSQYVAGDNKIWRVRAGGVAEHIAGTGVPGFRGDGGPAMAALLYGPAGDPQADAAGNIYFNDNNRLRRIDSQGVITTVAGTGQFWARGTDVEGPATSVALGVPGLLVTTSGDVYLPDSYIGVIRRLTPMGQLELVAGRPDDCYCSDGDGGPARAAHVSDPRFLTQDAAGNLYFVDVSRGVRRISPDGRITTVASGGAASSLVVDASGNIFGTDTVFRFVGRNTVQFYRLNRIGLDGSIQTILESTSILAAFANGSGRAVYVLGGKLIDVLDGTEIATIPSTPSLPYVPSPDGTPAREARLPNPSYNFAMAVNRRGELHFSDGCGIRKVDRDGLLRTVASLPCSGNRRSVAFDSQDRLWILTTSTSIAMVSPDGTPIPQALPISFFPSNTGWGLEITFDARDRLYIMGPAELNRLEQDGTVFPIFRYSFTAPVPAELPFPEAIGNDPGGNVYFRAWEHITLEHRVYRINDDGGFTQILGAFPDDDDRFTRFGVDAAGRVWQRLNCTNSNGVFGPGLYEGVYPADEGLVQSSLFGYIWQFVLAADGTMYVWDDGGIKKLSPVGRAVTPIISSGGIVHSASYTGGSIAPGELISIFGSNFGPSAGSVEVGQAVNNTLPGAVGRTKVLFDGIPGRITAVTSTQINVFVPYGVTVGSLVDIVVLVDDAPSLAMRVPVAEQAFGVFTTDASGSGPGAILNQDGSVNGPLNPALRGTIVSLFGTGAGLMFPALPDGALVISTPYSKPAVPVTVKIDGQAAEVLYAGAAPTLPNGAFQINVRIPMWIPQLAGSPPDTASISVTVGSSTTTRFVTVAVR